jgi:hypothetical protein
MKHMGGGDVFFYLPKMLLKITSRTNELCGGGDSSNNLDGCDLNGFYSWLGNTCCGLLMFIIIRKIASRNKWKRIYVYPATFFFYTLWFMW